MALGRPIRRVGKRLGFLDGDVVNLPNGETILDERRRRILFALNSLLPIVWMLRLFHVRVMRSGFANRIGHQLVEPLFVVHGIRFGGIVLCATPPEEVANEEILRRFPRRFIKVRTRSATRLLGLLARHPGVGLDTLPPVGRSDGTQEVFRYSDLLDGSFLRSRKKDLSELSTLLSGLGVDPLKPYVCLHVRQRGFAFQDDDIQDYRNSDIESYLLTIQELVRDGFTVIRVGEATSKSAPSTHNFVDYAHSAFKSPKNDVLLLQNCQFFIGNTSGLLAIPSERGIPILGVNMAPMGGFGVLARTSMSMPKLYRKGNSLMSFREALEVSVANLCSTYGFNDHGIELVDNSDIEICLAVRDFRMMISSNQHMEEMLREPRQVKFRSLLGEGINCLESNTPIAPSFLLAYDHLL